MVNDRDQTTVADPGIAGGGIIKGVDGGTEGPERARREAPECRGGAVWGAPPQYGGLGATPPENFQKINVEIAYFSAFLQAEMVFFAVAERQD